LPLLRERDKNCNKGGSGKTRGAAPPLNLASRDGWAAMPAHMASGGCTEDSLKIRGEGRETEGEKVGMGYCH